MATNKIIPSQLNTNFFGDAFYLKRGIITALDKVDLNTYSRFTSGLLWNTRIQVSEAFT